MDTPPPPKKVEGSNVREAQVRQGTVEGASCQWEESGKAPSSDSRWQGPPVWTTEQPARHLLAILRQARPSLTAVATTGRAHGPNWAVVGFWADRNVCPTKTRTAGKHGLRLNHYERRARLSGWVEYAISSGFRCGGGVVTRAPCLRRFPALFHMKRPGRETMPRGRPELRRPVGKVRN